MDRPDAHMNLDKSQPTDLNRRSLSWKRVLIFLLAFTPALFTGLLVWEKSVDIACWDTWENAPLLQKWHNGTLSWHDLYAPQIQHRIVIPRLIILTLSHLSGGDFRWENYFTFLLFLLSGLLTWRIMSKTLGRSLWVAAMAFAANLLIFSPMLFQILFWGAAMWMAIPVPCLLAILNAFTPDSPAPAIPPTAKRPWLLFAAALLLAEMATHSFSHGLVFWPVILVYILLHPKLAPLKTRLLMSGIWIAVAAGTIVSYFSNFYNVAFHAYNLKPGDYALEGGISLNSAENIKKFVNFFMGFLGNPFARTPFEDHPLDSSVFFGIWVLAAFLIVAALTVFTKTGRRLWPQALPWLALAAYVIGVALSISKGRAHIGEHRSTTTRYLVISSFLPIATMALAYLHSREWVTWLRQNPANWAARLLPSQAVSIVATAMLAVFCTAQIPSWRYSLHLTEIWHRARWQSKGLTMFLPHFQLSRDEMNVLCKDYKYCLDAVNILRSQGLFKTRILESPDLSTFTKDKKPMPKDKANVLTAQYLEDGGLEISGHARFGTKHPSDLVLITQGDKVIGLMQPQTHQWLRIYGLDYEFSNLEDLTVPQLYPWKGIVKAPALPDGDLALEAWALNVKDNRVARLPALIKVNKGTKAVSIETEGGKDKPQSKESADSN